MSIFSRAKCVCFPTIYSGATSGYIAWLSAIYRITRKVNRLFVWSVWFVYELLAPERSKQLKISNWPWYAAVCSQNDGICSQHDGIWKLGWPQSDSTAFWCPFWCASVLCRTITVNEIWFASNVMKTKAFRAVLECLVWLCLDSTRNFILTLAYSTFTSSDYDSCVYVN
jgi:hypothetical protein